MAPDSSALDLHSVAVSGNSQKSNALVADPLAPAGTQTLVLPRGAPAKSREVTTKLDRSESASVIPDLDRGEVTRDQDRDVCRIGIIGVGDKLLERLDEGFIDPRELSDDRRVDAAQAHRVQPACRISSRVLISN